MPTQKNLIYDVKDRKKSEVLMAIQWRKNGDLPDNVKPCVSQIKPPCSCGNSSVMHGVIKIPEGVFRVCPGDWIVTQEVGGQFPCKPDVFEDLDRM